MWRLLPFLFVCYLVVYLDRVNVGFAKLPDELGARPVGGGLRLWRAPLLACSYLSVRSTIQTARSTGSAHGSGSLASVLSWGSRPPRLFAFIAPISAATGISTEWVFCILRCLLGLAEAGFFPGIIFYLTLWFPSVDPGPGSLAVQCWPDPVVVDCGGPHLRALPNITGAGLDGWQWLFILGSAILMAFGERFFT